jgi:hypothetical protein
MDHPRLIPQAQPIKQIVLWMDIVHANSLAERFGLHENASLALRDEMMVDRWRFIV